MNQGIIRMHVNTTNQQRCENSDALLNVQKINFLICLNRHACCSMCASVKKAPAKSNPEEQHVMGKTNVCTYQSHQNNCYRSCCLYSWGNLQLCMCHQIKQHFLTFFPPVNNKACVVYMLLKVIPKPDVFFIFFSHASLGFLLC